MDSSVDPADRVSSRGASRAFLGTAAEERPPVPARSERLRRRLQHVSLRTKLIVPMVTLTILGGVAVGTITLRRTRRLLQDAAVARAVFDTTSRARTLTGFLQGVEADLRWVARLDTVQRLGAALARGDAEARAALHAAAERDLRVFAEGRPAFTQVRVIDRTGREALRLNRADEAPASLVTAPESQLQDKADRYYVRAGLALRPGEFYVSPWDLNEERGRIEDLGVGVVRYVAPVEGEDQTPLALVVLNIRGDHVHRLLGPMPPDTEAWLVDEAGVYLGYAGDRLGTARDYTVVSRRHLSADFAPEQVAAILGRDHAGLTAETDDAVLVATPVAVDEHRRWTLLWAHPREPLAAPVRALTGYAIGVMLLVALVAGTIGALVAGYLARPVEQLRRVTHEIADGDLSQRVTIGTADEIEALADDFNAMADRLQASQARLARWNEELEEEVARRTAQVRQMQAGLARTDKLASIGQMTAGILHEVGNPLAAIKTQIQVGQDGAGACGQCAPLFGELLREVDRLAAFLRSFARLARPRAPAFAPVSLLDVARGVRDLVGREARRRGVTLAVGGDAGLPPIRGDADQLRQVVMNLVLNALEASPAGGAVRVVVGTATGADGDAAACLAVEDDGCGIAPADLPRVFDPFFSTKEDGTGLGLAVCRDLVHAHGGTMAIASRPGIGTTVRVTLPAVAAACGTAALVEAGA